MKEQTFNITHSNDTELHLQKTKKTHIYIHEIQETSQKRNMTTLDKHLSITFTFTSLSLLLLYSKMSSVDGETEMKQMLFSASSVRFKLSACYVSTAKFINAHSMQSPSSHAQTV